MFLRGESPEAVRAAATAVFARMAAGGEDPLALVRDLAAALRPRAVGDSERAARAWDVLVALLEESPERCRALAETLLELVAGREQRALYTESGLLPNTGFFSELRRRLAHRLLPELTDERDLRDCVRLVFPYGGWWLRALGEEQFAALWRLLGDPSYATPDAHARMRTQMLDAAAVLSHRISAMGLEPELLRVLPRLAEGESPFVALCDHVAAYVGRCRAADEPGATANGVRDGEDEPHLLVLLEQCLDAVTRARQVAASRGTSMALTFLLVRLQQHLGRLDLLLGVLAVGYRPETHAELAERWGAFMRDALGGELQRNNVRRHTQDVLGLLSLRVTENASRTGEHYIARDRREWAGMWLSAAVGGCFIACMALLKVFGAGLHLAALNQGILNGLIYGVGFMLIHVCHGTVATKQPAMTAATLASALGNTRRRVRDEGKLTDLVAATARTQGAAIAGNLAVAFPLALALAALLGFGSGDVVPASKAATMLAELDPLRVAPLVYAAVAGVWLFAAGLVSGYIDNLMTYGRIGERVARHPWLPKVAGEKAAAWFGRYLDRNAGGLAGNLFFGLMLGLTPVFGVVTGLPVDIRHIAFSAANLAYAGSVPGHEVTPWLLFRSAAGVLLIGTVNLAMSFFLALWLALRSRGADLGALRGLLPAVARTFRSAPLKFFFPPRGGA